MLLLKRPTSDHQLLPYRCIRYWSVFCYTIEKTRRKELYFEEMDAVCWIKGYPQTVMTIHYVPIMVHLWSILVQKRTPPIPRLFSVVQLRYSVLHRIKNSGLRRGPPNIKWFRQEWDHCAGLTASHGTCFLEASLQSQSSNCKHTHPALGCQLSQMSALLTGLTLND